jgi:thermitase
MKRAMFTGLLLTIVSLQSQAAEYLVKYQNQVTLNHIRQVAPLRLPGVRLMDVHSRGQYVRVNVNDAEAGKTLAQLVAFPGVQWVVPNFKLYAFGKPIKASALQEQWAIAKVQAEKAWERASSRGGHKITVAVIDTGVDYTHKNLAPNMVPGYDFHANDTDPMDETSEQNPGHGTHVAGIIAATGLVDGGTIGVGPEVSVMPIRFLGKDGSGDLNAAIKAIDFAIEKKVQVISASWGATVPRSQATALIEAVQRADKAGVIFVAAAANDGRNNDTTDVFPANAGTPNMISVAASGSSDAKPEWSNYGKGTVHLASPGEKILSTLPGNQYGDLSGTSMATPLISGLVAFLKAQDPSLTGVQVRSLLQATGAKVNIETACNCRIDAFAAVDQLLTKRIWLVPAAITIEEKASLQVTAMNAKAPVKYTSSNPSVLTISESGQAQAVTKGTATVSITDAEGVTATSLDYNVGVVAPSNPGGECMIGDPALCEIACGIYPDLPFCKK